MSPAGDAFNAGYIAVRLRGGTIADAIRAGARCGAAVAASMSDTAGFPRTLAKATTTPPRFGLTMTAPTSEPLKCLSRQAPTLGPVKSSPCSALAGWAKLQRPSSAPRPRRCHQGAAVRICRRCRATSPVRAGSQGRCSPEPPQHRRETMDGSNTATLLAGH